MVGASGHNMGTYKAKEKAERHLKQAEVFQHMKKRE